MLVAPAAPRLVGQVHQRLAAEHQHAAPPVAQPPADLARGVGGVAVEKIAGVGGVVAERRGLLQARAPGVGQPRDDVRLNGGERGVVRRRHRANALQRGGDFRRIISGVEGLAHRRQQARTDDAGVVARHIGNQQVERRAVVQVRREPPALDARHRAPHRVHARDVQAVVKQRARQMFQAAGGQAVGGRLDQARRAARQQKQKAVAGARP